MSNVSSEAPVPEHTCLARKRPGLTLRARVIQSMRCFFQEQGFLEVETPAITLAPAPEFHIEPIPLLKGGCLITSPELHMKRLLASGYEKIFQICKVFRRGERGHRHHPEFTLLEWYRLHGDQKELQEDCRGLLHFVCQSAQRESGWSYRGKWLDVKAPWEKWTVREAFLRHAGYDPLDHSSQETFEESLVQEVEPWLGFPAPCFLTDYPASQAALARVCAHDPTVCERFELYWAAIELANGFTELTDAVEQRSRFEAVMRERQECELPSYSMPEKFLKSLERLEPCAGIALGVDRLVMLLADAPSLDDVVAFPPSFS